LRAPVVGSTAPQSITVRKVPTPPLPMRWNSACEGTSQDCTEKNPRGAAWAGPTRSRQVRETASVAVAARRVGLI